MAINDRVVNVSRTLTTLVWLYTVAIVVNHKKSVVDLNYTARWGLMFNGSVSSCNVVSCDRCESCN